VKSLFVVDDFHKFEGHGGEFFLRRDGLLLFEALEALAFICCPEGLHGGVVVAVA